MSKPSKANKKSGSCCKKYREQKRCKKCPLHKAGSD